MLLSLFIQCMLVLNRFGELIFVLHLASLRHWLPPVEAGRLIQNWDWAVIDNKIQLLWRFAAFWALSSLQRGVSSSLLLLDGYELLEHFCSSALMLTLHVLHKELHWGVSRAHHKALRPVLAALCSGKWEWDCPVPIPRHGCSSSFAILTLPCRLCEAGAQLCWVFFFLRQLLLDHAEKRPQAEWKLSSG